MAAGTVSCVYVKIFFLSVLHLAFLVKMYPGEGSEEDCGTIFYSVFLFPFSFLFAIVLDYAGTVGSFSSLRVSAGWISRRLRSFIFGGDLIAYFSRPEEDCGSSSTFSRRLWSFLFGGDLIAYFSRPEEDCGSSSTFSRRLWSFLFGGDLIALSAWFGKGLDEAIWI